MENGLNRNFLSLDGHVVSNYELNTVLSHLDDVVGHNEWR